MNEFLERLAREAGLGPLLDNSLKDGDDVWIDCDVSEGLEKFAAAVAAHENEACAKVRLAHTPNHPEKTAPRQS